MQLQLVPFFSAFCLVVSGLALYTAHKKERRINHRMKQITDREDMEIQEAMIVTGKIEKVISEMIKKRDAGNYMVDSGRVIDDLNKALTPAPGTRMYEINERKKQHGNRR